MTSTDDNNHFWIGDIGVSPQHNQLVLGGHTLTLQPKVMAVLYYLAQHQDRVISNEELIDEVWKGRVVTHGSVQKSMNSLRNAFTELAGEQEFVAHYSKRGYQLVVPARFQEVRSVPSESRSLNLRSERWWLPVLLITVGLVVLVWYVGHQNDHDDNLAVTKTHLTQFQARIDFTQGEGAERSAEPHPDGQRVAYVRDLDVDSGANKEARSLIVIRGLQGLEWTLASVEGSWTNLAWSASGRNLVAVEKRVADGLPAPQAFYSKSSALYTLHIFTLDFKGQRLLEKNLLSQWQGVIESVTWWDENTLEFVASQGGNSNNERYRYVVAEQKLEMLKPLESGFVPLRSTVREKVTAVLSRGRNRVQIEFLNAEQHAVAISPAESENLDISWIPDGSGVLVLDRDTNRLWTHYLDGGTVAVEISQDSSVSLSYPRYRHQGESILVAASTSPAVITQVSLDGTSNIIHGGDGFNPVPVFSPDGRSIAFAALQGHQLQLWRVHDGLTEPLSTLENPIANLVWSEDGHFLLYRSGQAIWQFQFDVGTPLLLFQGAGQAEPLAYEPATDTIWFVKSTRGTRNIWRNNRLKQTEQQLTFGSVGAAKAYGGKIYFQYVNQSGLWMLGEDVQGVSQLSAQLPANSQLLRLVAGGVYFVTGGRCHEADIQYLDFNSDSLTSTFVRGERAVISYDFHPIEGVLQLGCEQPNAHILEYVSGG